MRNGDVIAVVAEHIACGPEQEILVRQQVSRREGAAQQSEGE